MKIAVIGGGNIGGTLARKWAAAGHQLMLGVRDSSSPKATALKKELGGMLGVGSIEEALTFGEAVLLAIPGAAVASTVQQLGSKLDGKLVVDATNNLRGAVMNSVEAIKQAAPRANIFRAFNSLPWETYANPEIAGQRADLMFCGPASGREMMEKLIRDAGLNPVYVGELQWVQVVDALGGLAFALMPRVGRHLAFKLVTA